MRWSTSHHSSKVKNRLCWMFLVFLLSEATPAQKFPSVTNHALLTAKLGFGDETALTRRQPSSESNHDYLTMKLSTKNEMKKSSDETEAESENEEEEDDGTDKLEAAMGTLSNTKGLIKDIKDVSQIFTQEGSVEGGKAVAKLILKGANVVADFLPDPLTKGFVKMSIGILGNLLGESSPSPEEIMDKKLDALKNDLKHGLVNLENQMVNLENKIENISDDVNRVDRKIDNVTKNIEDVKETQKLHTGMLVEMKKNLKVGFHQLSQNFETKLKEMQMEMHENMFIQVVKIPARDLNRGVTALMTDPSPRSASYMRHMCEAEVPSRVFSSVTEYVMAPDGYYKKIMDYYGYTLETFYKLKTRIRHILNAVIFAEVLCTSLNVLKSNKFIRGNLTEEPKSVILDYLVHEYNEVMVEVNKKRNMIIAQHWEQIPIYLDENLPHVVEEVLRSEYIEQMENSINSLYAFKTQFFLTAGKIETLLVDSGGLELSMYNAESKDKVNTGSNFYARVGEAAFDFVLYRKFTHGSIRSAIIDGVEKANPTKKNEDVTNWYKVVSKVGPQGTSQTPILYIVASQVIVSGNPNHTTKWVPVASNNKQTLLQLKHK